MITGKPIEGFTYSEQNNLELHKKYKGLVISKGEGERVLRVLLNKEAVRTLLHSLLDVYSMVVNRLRKYFGGTSKTNRSWHSNLGNNIRQS